MPFQEMKIKGAWIHSPIRHNDERGHFEEQFKLSQIELELGRSFLIKQVNQSVSAKGVLRGVHYSTSENGQDKYVSCPNGAILDFVVDLRVDSETYGIWDSVLLTEQNTKSVFISKGLGHAFLALEDYSVANYLCSSEYDPKLEKTINAFSSFIGLPLQEQLEKYNIPKFILSSKDREAPHALNSISGVLGND